MKDIKNVIDKLIEGDEPAFDTNVTVEDTIKSFSLPYESVKSIIRSMDEILKQVTDLQDSVEDSDRNPVFHDHVMSQGNYPTTYNKMIESLVQARLRLVEIRNVLDVDNPEWVKNKLEKK